MLVATPPQVREADRLMREDYAYPTLLLMETAGRKAADLLLRTYPNIAQYVLLCGAGNNGGDGLVTARYLHQAGKHCWVVLVAPADKASDDNRVNYQIVAQAGIKITLFNPNLLKELEPYLRVGTLIIDALIGTGLKGKLSQPMQQVVDYFKPLPNSVVALDVPSGLNAETGELFSEPLKAELTITFQYPKACHYVTPATLYCGEVRVLDIGIYPEVTAQLGNQLFLLTDTLLRQWYRPRKLDSHKGSYGHVFLAGGSKGKAGAIALAALSCLEVGAGLCTAFIPGSIACSFHRTHLENMSVPYGKDTTPHLNETAAEVFASYLQDKTCVAIGPGLGNNADTAAFLKQALHALQHPLVLDADALNLLAENPVLWDYLPANTILTPHPGEMARLLQIEAQTVQARRLEAARELAAQRKVIVVLKGAGSIVAAPDGTAYLNILGNPGMATAGAGDVLTGAIAGLIAQGYPAFQAAAMAVYIHARAGDRVARTNGQEGVVASKIMRTLGVSLKEAVHQAK